MAITGKTLIDLGYKPGKWFADAIKGANEQGLENGALIAYLDACAPTIVQPFNEPVPYVRNISAESPKEISNVESVIGTMDVLMKTPTLVGGAVMPDACPVGSPGVIPVGGVAVAKNAIHPAMHSADVCCSVMMTNFGKVDPKKVLDAAHSVTHFGGGGRHADKLFDLPKNLADQIAENKLLNNEASTLVARTHLGTQGDGNHFLYVGKLRSTDETVMVTHHGSRGFGAKLFTQGKKLAEMFRKEISPNTKPHNAWIPFDDDWGKIYWEALQIVRTWTKTNHEVLHQATVEATGAETQFRFWNEHNFVFREGDLFYHAKGATPLADKFVPDSTDGLRLVPLNMSEPVLIVKGETTERNLGFAPHGAGRNVSRSQHIRSKGGRSKESIFAEETEGLDVRFFSGEIDISELPSAYKNADALQQQMKEFGLGEVIDFIDPYGCIMAGDWKANAPWRRKKRRRRKR